MSERPFMQLYVSDFLGDTLDLSTEGIGAYMLLLMAMWNAGGTLPNDDAKLARIVRMSVKKWRAVRAEMMVYFDVAGDIILHHRLTKELEKSERQSESRAAAGSKGGAATALKNNKSHRAIATARPTAVTQHLPEPYRKEGAHAAGPTDGLVPVNRYLEPELFKACEELTEVVPGFLATKSWPVDVVVKARAKLVPTKADAA